MSLFKSLIGKTIDDAGCAVWKLSCCNGHPAMRKNGKTVLVRRAVWEDENSAIPAGNIVRMTCETKNCITPWHMELTTFSKLGKQMGSLGRMSGPLRSAKIAATKRAKHSKLTNDDVVEIRSSLETGRAMAVKFGVNETHISRIKRNKCWKDFTNPFSGLAR